MRDPEDIAPVLALQTSSFTNPWTREMLAGAYRGEVVGWLAGQGVRA